MNFSSVFAGITNVAADIIVAIAIHVPFLMHALINHPAVLNKDLTPQTSADHASTTSLRIQLSPEEMAAWQKKHDMLLAQKCSGFCKPFDMNSFFENTKPDQRDRFNFASTSTNRKITLTLLTDVAHQSRNPSYEVDLEGSRIGEVGGQSISQSSYSPDGKYFALRAVSHLGGGYVFDVSIYVIDIAQKKVGVLSTYNLVDTSASKGNPFIDSMSYIESYTWTPDDKINLVQYTVSSFPDESVYRTSPKQIWQFTLDSMSDRTLLQTLTD